jgi:hypothetical protein
MYVGAAGVTRVHTTSEDGDQEPRAGLVAAAMVGQKTAEVHARYAIVDEAIVCEAALKETEEAKVRRTTAQRTAQSDQSTADR